MYILFWVVFGAFIIQDSEEHILTFWNLVLPNLLAFSLIILFTKEWFIGYRPKNTAKNLFTLVLVVLVGIYILITQFDLYVGFVNNSEWFFPGVIPVVFVLISFIGLLVHRVGNNRI